MGCYAFDTACAYGEGASERVIGQWLKKRNNRNKIIIIDKGAHPVGGISRVNPENIKEDLQESLQRLETDYIDLYLIHRDDPTVPVAPIIEVLNELKNQRKITLFGASNWTRERLEEAEEYAEKKGLFSFSASSNQFSLATQYDDPFPGTVSVKSAGVDSELEWYKKTQYPLLSWSSLARGFFSGKFTRGNLDEFTDQQSLMSIRCYAREDNFVRLERAAVLAAEIGKTVAQIALAYIFAQPLNCFAVTGSLELGHFEENIEAIDITLTEKEASWLDLKSEYPD